MKLLATFLFFVSATISVQANSDRVIHLGDNASITISKDASFGEYRDQAVRIQLGNYASYSPAQSCVAGSLYIVLDPFAPLDDCYDGYIASQSLLQITPDNLPDLTSEDFKTFSFFSEDKSTIGLVQNSCGTAGGSYWYVFYDLQSGQLFGFEPGYIAKGVCGQTHWIDSEQRPPIVGDTETRYWWFNDKVSYNTTTTYIEKVWSGDYLSDDNPISQDIMEKEYAAAVAKLDDKTLTDLRSLVAGSEKSAVADEPSDFPGQLSRLFSFLYYAKKSGHITEAKAIIESLPSELQYVITDPDEYGDWYEIIDPYRRDKFQKAYELWLSDCAHGVTKEINRVDGEYGEVLIYSMPRIILDENTVECLTGNDNTGSTSGSVTLFPSKIGRVGASEGKKLMTEALLWDDFYLYFVAAPKSDLGIENVEYLDNGFLFSAGYLTHSRNYLYSGESHEIRRLLK